MPYPVKCGVKLLIHSQTSTMPPLTFRNGWAISTHFCNACNYLSYVSMSGFKLLYGSKKGEGAQINATRFKSVSKPYSPHVLYGSIASFPNWCSPYSSRHISDILSWPIIMYGHDWIKFLSPCHRQGIDNNKGQPGSAWLMRNERGLVACVDHIPVCPQHGPLVGTTEDQKRARWQPWYFRCRRIKHDSDVTWT